MHFGCQRIRANQLIARGRVAPDSGDEVGEGAQLG